MFFVNIVTPYGFTCRIHLRIMAKWNKGFKTIDLSNGFSWGIGHQPCWDMLSDTRSWSSKWSLRSRPKAVHRSAKSGGAKPRSHASFTIIYNHYQSLQDILISHKMLSVCMSSGVKSLDSNFTIAHLKQIHPGVERWALWPQRGFQQLKGCNCHMRSWKVRMEYLPNDNLLIIFLSKSHKLQSQTGQPAKQRQGANQYMSKQGKNSSDQIRWRKVRKRYACESAADWEYPSKSLASHWGWVSC